MTSTAGLASSLAPTSVRLVLGGDFSQSGGPLTVDLDAFRYAWTP